MKSQTVSEIWKKTAHLLITFRFFLYDTTVHPNYSRWFKTSAGQLEPNVVAGLHPILELQMMKNLKNLLKQYESWRYIVAQLLQWVTQRCLIELMMLSTKPIIPNFKLMVVFIALSSLTEFVGEEPEQRVAALLYFS